MKGNTTENTHREGVGVAVLLCAQHYQTNGAKMEHITKKKGKKTGKMNVPLVYTSLLPLSASCWNTLGVWNSLII